MLGIGNTNLIILTQQYDFLLLLMAMQRYQDGTKLRDEWIGMMERNTEISRWS